MRRIFVLVPLCILFLACQDWGNEAVVGPTVVIAKTSYAVAETISITIANEKDPTIYLQKCCDRLTYYIDRLDGTGRWTQYGSSDIPCPYECGADGQPVPSWFFVAPVWPSHPYQQSVHSEIKQKGTYRFRFLYRFVDSWNSRLDSEELTSNSFTIE